MISISSKKRMKEFDFTTLIPQNDLFSFIFWRKLETPKNHFEIIWPLESAIYHSMKPPFDAEIDEKFVNGIYWAPYYKIMLIPSGQ